MACRQKCVAEPEVATIVRPDHAGKSRWRAQPVTGTRAGKQRIEKDKSPKRQLLGRACRLTHLLNWIGQCEHCAVGKQ